MYTVPKLKSYSAAALDKAVEKLRAALSEEGFTAAWEEGRTLNWEQAVASALEENGE